MFFLQLVQRLAALCRSMPLLETLGCIAGAGVVGGVAFKKYGYKLGEKLLEMKTDGEIKKVGLSYRKLQLPSGEEQWFLERPGSSEHPTLVVIPGLTTRAEQAAEWVLFLNVPADRRIIILELPGHGRNRRESASEVKLSPPEISDWFVAVMQKLDVAEVDLYGHSTGAGCAALSYVNRGVAGPTVRNAVLCSPFVPEVLDDDFYPVGARQMGWKTAEEFVHLVRTYLNVSAPLPGFILEAIERERASWPEDYWYELSKQVVTKNPVLGPPRKTTANVLLVWGEKDKVCAISKSDAVIRAVPDAKLMKMPGCGHAGVDGSATANIFSESASAASKLFFGEQAGPSSKL